METICFAVLSRVLPWYYRAAGDLRSRKIKDGVPLGRLPWVNASLASVAFLSIADSICRLKDFADKDLVKQPSHQKKLHAKALSIGLENPASILCNVLDGAKAQLRIQQRQYEQRFQATPSQLLLQGGVDAEDSAEDEENDSMDVFEFDEDGMVL